MRGLTFEELFQSGHSTEMRSVQLLLPEGSEELLRTIPGMEDFNPDTECLELLKPGFGLKDAPRLWSPCFDSCSQQGWVATNHHTQTAVRKAQQRRTVAGAYERAC